MKIHIIGCSGSGKTYLAKALSKKYNVPHFDLDDIQWDNNSDGYGVKMPIGKRTELLNKNDEHNKQEYDNCHTDYCKYRCTNKLAHCVVVNF